MYFRYFGDKLDDADQVSYAQFEKNEAYPCFGYSYCDVIEMWTVIRNGEKKPVTLEKFASAAMPFRQGDLYRILSPYQDKGFASEILVSEDKSEAVFFAYKFRQYAKQQDWPAFRFDGLDPDAKYTLTELNRIENPESWEGKTFSGRFLMNTGLELKLKGVYSSCVIKCTKN